MRIRLLTTDDSVSKNIFLGSYEKGTTTLLSRIVLPGDIIFDVGANIGYYSIIFSKWAGLTGQVHSFEPSRREFLSLAENVNLNHLNNVYLNQLAVSDGSGIVEMAVQDDPAYGAYNTIGIPTHHRIEKKIYSKQTVRTIAMDEYSSSYTVQKPSIIKIDVEGAELNVLKGGKDMLSADDGPILVLEICEETLKGLKIFPDQVLRLLNGFSYTLFSIRTDGFLVPFNEESSMNLVAVKGHLLARFVNMGLIIEG